MSNNLLSIVAIIGLVIAVISFCFALYTFVAWFIAKHQGEEGIE